MPIIDAGGACPEPGNRTSICMPVCTEYPVPSYHPVGIKPSVVRRLCWAAGCKAGIVVGRVALINKLGLL